MRVCIISGFPPIPKSGAESTYKIVKNLVNHQDVSSIHILANRNNSALTEEIRGKVYIYRVWKRNSITSLFKILQYVKRINPHVVDLEFGYTFYGNAPYTFFYLTILLLGLRIMRRRVVITHHGIISHRQVTEDLLKEAGFRGPRLVYSMGILLVNRLMCILSHHIITRTKEEEKLLEQLYGFRNATTIAFGVDEVPSIKKEDARRMLGFDLEERILLCFGFIEPRKGIEYAIKAMPLIIRHYPDVKLVIVGEASKKDYVNRLKSLIKGLNIEKHVLLINSFIPESKVMAFFGAADVIIMPYTSQISISGILRLAMAHGIPPIASNLGTFKREIINGVHGLLFEPKNEKSLAEKVINLLSDNELWLRIHHNLLKTAYKFSWQNYVEEMVKVYRYLLGVMRR
jgi:glycosyltransferase involved in cell wall biosynthesis